MAKIAVSFFSDLDVQSRSRRVLFPRADRQGLHKSIRGAMQDSEFFACYHAPDGGVIALDRQGVARI
mgnify:CR=1 FL=1